MAKRCTSFFNFGFSLSLAIIALQLVEAGLPPVFIFGDSTFDVGTNDYLNGSQARADFRPNGIDYPHSSPTGRFSNGYNTADYIAMLLGHKQSPPSYFHLASNMFSFRMNILRGVNFASGGSGLLYNTGFLLHVVPLEDQIKQFETVVTNMTAFLGQNRTAEKLSRSIFLISVGSNDILDYEAFYKNNESVLELLGNLQSAYQDHLTNLYGLGARKFGIISVPPLGCCPASRILNSTGGCLGAPNDIAQAFYVAIEDLLYNLSQSLSGMIYSLGRAFEMTKFIIDNPSYANLTEVQSACCGGGWLNGHDPCNRTANLCQNRSDYLFWDRFHPTAKVAQLAATTLYNGTIDMVSPMNFSQLALINL